MKQLITTGDGSHTIFVPGLNEHYHSVHGAVQESTVIYINAGYEWTTADPLNILEIGFGTGLNALLTALACKEGSREVFYTTIEKYPLEESMIKALNHHLFGGESGSELHDLIHSAPWDTWVPVLRNFNLRKIKADITSFQPEGKYNLIYFDAFGPDKQPEVWSPEVFSTIASVTEKGGVFVTYSAKGEVKRRLKACGFEVALLPGPPGKRQIIRAVKK